MSRVSEILNENEPESLTRTEKEDRLAEERWSAYCDEGSGQNKMLIDLIEEVNGDFESWFKDLLKKKFSTMSDYELDEQYDWVYGEDEDED